MFAALALRAGLAIRRRRLSSSPPDRRLRSSHLRVARPAVLLVLAGIVGGPVSSALLRDWRPFGTFHGWLGLLVVVLFGVAGWLGWRLQHGKLERSRGANAHGLIGVLAMLGAAIAAAAGMVLLP